MPSRLSVVHIATFMSLSWRLFSNSFKFVRGTTTENEQIMYKLSVMILGVKGLKLLNKKIVHEEHWIMVWMLMCKHFTR